MAEKYSQFIQLMRQKRYEQAFAFAERQYLLEEKQSIFWLTQQAVALNKASKCDKAHKIACQALDIQPANLYALEAAADALLGKGKYKEAQAHYKEIVSAQEERLKVRAQKGVLECLVHTRDWQEILNSITQWHLPEKENIRFKVKAYIGLKKYSEAEQTCRDWLKLMPDHPQALWELTELEIKRDGIDAVLFRLGKLVKIPSLAPVYKDIYASLCKRVGKYDLALKQYEKLETSGAQQRIQRKQVFILAKSGKEREAIPLLEELLRKNPADIYLNSSYSAACKRISQVERAVNFYIKLLQLFPEVKSLYGHKKRLMRILTQD